MSTQHISVDFTPIPYATSDCVAGRQSPCLASEISDIRAKPIGVYDVKDARDLGRERKRDKKGFHSLNLFLEVAINY